MRLIDNLKNVFGFTNRKNFNNVKKTEARVFGRTCINKKHLIKKIFYYHSRICFFKRFVISSIRVRKFFRQVISVCNFSGKHRSSISNISLKRHEFKKLLTINNGPSFIKKFKKLFLNYKFTKFNIVINNLVFYFFKFKFFFFKINFYSSFFFFNSLFPMFNSFSVKRRRFSFVGKTYKFYKKRNKIRYFFNRAYKTNLYFFKLMRIVKKKKKYKIFFFSSIDFYFYIKYIKMIRKLNVFTRRGIKTSKLFVFKKKGKISAYRLKMLLYKGLRNIFYYFTHFFDEIFFFKIDAFFSFNFISIYVFIYTYIFVLLFLFFYLIISTVSVKYINYTNIFYLYLLIFYVLFIVSTIIMHISLIYNFKIFFNFNFYKFFFGVEYSYFGFFFSSKSCLFSCVTIQIAFFVNIFSFFYNKFSVSKVSFFFLLNYFFFSMVFLFQSNNFVLLFFF